MKFHLPCAFCALAIAASAATSTSWEINGFSDFLKGRLSNLSLSADGLLQLGPAIRSTATLGQPALWSFAAAPDGSLYAGTGHSGKVYKLTPGGQQSVVWSAQQSEIFALSVDAKGILYAGTSPNGGLYRLENGTTREIWRAPAKYIWAIQPAPNGSLFVATGEPGRVYRIDPSTGAADLYYETGQANVTALASGPNGHLLAGTDPNGILYEISAPKQATILLDSTLPEIRSIAVDSHGVVYAAAMGGAVSTRSPLTAASAAASGAVVAGAPTVITVTEARQSGLNVQSDQSGLKAGAGEAKPPSSASPAVPSTPSVVEVAGVEKSAIYRIGPDHAIETIRSSKESNVYDLLVDADGLVFSTDEHARIYRWTPSAPRCSPNLEMARPPGFSNPARTCLPRLAIPAASSLSVLPDRPPGRINLRCTIPPASRVGGICSGAALALPRTSVLAPATRLAPTQPGASGQSPSPWAAQPRAARSSRVPPRASFSGALNFPPEATPRSIPSPFRTSRAMGRPPSAA